MPDLRVTQQHLEHDAYLYIRQSTPRQVLENTESTQRQYALRDRAVALGWPLERIHVLDCDLGKSGSQSVGRDGFQKLVSEVALGNAGPGNGSGGIATCPELRRLASFDRTMFSGRRAHSRRGWNLRPSEL